MFSNTRVLLFNVSIRFMAPETLLVTKLIELLTALKTVTDNASFPILETAFRAADPMPLNPFPSPLKILLLLFAELAVD